MEFPDFGLPTYSFTVFSSLRSVYVDAGLPVACVLNLQGDQGTGKSTLAKRFVSLYNVHNAIADAYDADSTFASMRDALSSTRDRAVLFDDICKSSDPLIQRKRRRDAANLVRMATNGLPITWKSGGKTIHANCNACLVITGEVDFDQPSDLTRCVTVIISQQMTNGSDADRSDAATALAGFLQWFSKHYEEEKNRLINEYRAFCSCARSHREERLHISLWELSWAMSSFLRFAVEVNAVTERGAQYINDRFSKILTNIHSRTVRKIDSLTVKNSVTIQSLIMIGAQKKAFPYILHNGCVCVRSAALTNFLNAAMKRNDLRVKDVTAYLRNENLLKVDKSGKSTCKINGIRMLCIPVNALK